MRLSQKTLEKLRDLINEETEYRSGPKLVSFFNQLSFNDSYSQGFPSRWIFTDNKLSAINGTPEIDTCIKNLFAPIGFIGRYSELDNLINDFNQYLAFDNWKVIRNNKDITFARADAITFEHENKASISEDDFLKRDFENLNLDTLGLDSTITTIIKLRIEEMKSILNEKSPLASIILIGSTLEGILLGVAFRRMAEVNRANASPKDNTGKVLKFSDWTLSNLIDVFCELNFLGQDVGKFSHALREFRNYIHPYKQMSSNFNPDKRTAEICWKVLLAAIEDINEI